MGKFGEKLLSVQSNKAYQRLFKELEHYLIMPLTKKDIAVIYNIRNCAILIQSKKEIDPKIIQEFINSKTEFGIEVYQVNIDGDSGLIDKYQGGTEQNIKIVFEIAKNKAPLVLIIPNIHLLTDLPMAAKQLSMEIKENKHAKKTVYVVATTNLAKKTHQDFLSSNCFDKVITLRT